MLLFLLGTELFKALNEAPSRLVSATHFQRRAPLTDTAAPRSHLENFPPRDTRGTSKAIKRDNNIGKAIVADHATLME
jgi:hypothetical protein